MLQPLRFYTQFDVLAQLEDLQHIPPEKWSQCLVKFSDGETYFMPYFTLLKDFLSKLDVSLLPSAFTLAHIETIQKLLEHEIVQSFLSNASLNLLLPSPDLSPTLQIVPLHILAHPEEYSAQLKALQSSEEKFEDFLLTLKGSISILPSAFTLQTLLAYQELFDHVLLQNGLLSQLFDLKYMTAEKVSHSKREVEQNWFPDTVLAKALYNYAKILHSFDTPINFDTMWSSIEEINPLNIPFFSRENGLSFTLDQQTREAKTLKTRFDTFDAGTNNQDITKSIDPSPFVLHIAVFSLILHTLSATKDPGDQLQSKILMKNIHEHLNRGQSGSWRQLRARRNWRLFVVLCVRSISLITISMIAYVKLNPLQKPLLDPQKDIINKICTMLVIPLIFLEFSLNCILIPTTAKDSYELNATEVWLRAHVKSLTEIVEKSDFNEAKQTNVRLNSP